MGVREGSRLGHHRDLTLCGPPGLCWPGDPPSLDLVKLGSCYDLGMTQEATWYEHPASAGTCEDPTPEPTSFAIIRSWSPLAALC